MTTLAVSDQSIGRTNDARGNHESGSSDPGKMFVAKVRLAAREGCPPSPLRQDDGLKEIGRIIMDDTFVEMVVPAEDLKKQRECAVHFARCEVDPTITGRIRIFDARS